MTTPSDIPRRRNGLSPPYNAAQISSWIFLLATVAHFAIFIAPILPFEVVLPVSICFYLVVFSVVYFGFRAITIDSMDVHLKKTLLEERNGILKTEGKFLDFCYGVCNNKNHNHNAGKDGEETKQCWICDTQVAEHSMHCKYCNKCVSKFDHHCLWLNTCVGEHNYRDFFRVMLAISLMQIIHFGISVYLVVDIFLGGPSEDRADDWLGVSGDNTHIAIAVVLLVFIFFDISSLILLFQLIAFHVHLQKERITTYQFIIQDSQKRRDKAKLSMELDQMRLTETARAKEKGESCYAFRLRLGGQCRQMGCAIFDPLEMPRPPPEPDRNEGFASALGPNITGTTDTPEQAGENEGNHIHETDDYYQDEHRSETDEGNGCHRDCGSNGVGYLPVAANGGMTDERHELDSQATHSELGDPEDVATAPKVSGDDGELLGAGPRDIDEDEEDNEVIYGNA